MDQESVYLRNLMKENRKVLLPLTKYLSWLEQAGDKATSSIYSGEGIAQTSVAFPVYDATLLSFIREAQKSSLMDRNYPYVYSRKGIKTHDQERRFIVACDWREWDSLRGILSKYVLGGQTKASLWSEGVTEKIFYLTIMKMQEIIDYWDCSTGE
jgi:hypothetical protein